MENGVESLDARHGDPGVAGQLDGRAEIGLDLHGPPGGIVLPHDAFDLVGLGHFVHGQLLEVGRELAAIGLGQAQQLVHDVGDHVLDAHLFQQGYVIRRFEDDADGMKSNGPVRAVLC